MRLIFGLAILTALSACNMTGEDQKASIETVVSAGDNLSASRINTETYSRYLSAREPAELRTLLNKPAIQQELVLDFHSDNVLADYAQSIGLEEHDLVRERIERATRKILITALVDHVESTLTYPSEEQLDKLAREYYLRHEKAFQVEQRRRVAHILLADHSACPCDIPTVDERLKSIQEALANGKDFAELARAYSDDKGTAENGGELPESIVPDGKLVRAFEKEAFALVTEGEVSEPFKTKFGTHLIKLLELIPSQQIPYEEVRERIMEKKKQDILNSELEKLRSDAYPKLETMNLDALNNVIESLIEQKSEK